MGKLSDRVRQTYERVTDIESRPYLAKLREQNKMHVRERVNYLFDKGTFVEDGVFARCDDDKLPTDAVVTGIEELREDRSV